ncbi:ribonuclease P protein component [Selenomonadales bacterium OttesenSCG-928-I06]|nr:ribonuclease P protein component [Selenomonadales bacterium OttesenSCG-928-I06]
MKKYTLSKKRKLSSKKFQKVYKNGKSYANKYLVLYVFKSEKNLVGFAAGKKLGSAVVRNKVKRRLREIYRLNQTNISRNYSLILVGRKYVIKANYKLVEDAFLDLVYKAGLVK